MPAASALAAAPLPAALGARSSLAIGFFLAIVLLTLVLTFFAARRNRTTAAYYAAGRPVSAAQNGLALAGDYMSAASFLGLAGMVALHGYDGMIYAAGWLAGWPVLLILVAEPLRSLGNVTFADVVAARFRPMPVRIAAALGGLATVLLYTAAQMVASGALIRLLFGVPYVWAQILVGAAMMAYLLFGGLVATTSVQIIKAVLLLVGVSGLAALVLSRFGWDPTEVYAAVARQYGPAALEPGGLLGSPLEVVSLGLALMFGLLGLPHILMRFYTVPDARAARRSVVWATGFIGYFYLIIPVVGFGAAALLGREVIASFGGHGNLAAPLLAELLAGAPFLGFIAAVAFATILAVVSGLTLAAASAYSHDIYLFLIKGGRATEEEQVRAAKAGAVGFGIAAVALGIAFEGLNVAVVVGLAFAIAASANTPALLLSLAWRRFTTWGAVSSIATGAFTSVALIVLGPTVWGEVLGHRDAAGGPVGIISLQNPAIVSMTAALAVGLAISLLTREPAPPRAGPGPAAG